MSTEIEYYKYLHSESKTREAAIFNNIRAIARKLVSGVLFPIFSSSRLGL